jgi:hypothetical protein
METLKSFECLCGLSYDYANFVIRSVSRYSTEKPFKSEYLFGCETLDGYSDSFGEALEFFQEQVKNKADLYSIMSHKFKIVVELFEIRNGQAVLLKKMNLSN